MSVRLRPAACLRSRLSSYACTRCVDACPEGAIAAPREGALPAAPDGASCTDCGACVPACPADAIAGADAFDPLAVVVAPGSAETLVLGCRRGPRGGGRHVDCLGQLGETDLVALRALARRPIELDATDCGRCPRASMLPILVARVGAVSAADLPGTSSIAVVSDRRELGRREPALTRRDFFRSLRPAAPPDPRATDGGRKPLPRSRRLLATLAARLEPERQRALARATDFALRFAASCDRCGRCAAVCPTGALRRHRRGGRREVGFAAERCSGCGLCVAFCPLAAVALESPTPAPVNDRPRMNGIPIAAK